MRKNTLLIIVILFIVSCNQKKLSPAQIVNKAIEASGGDNYKTAEITFQFRDKKYRSKRKNGEYQLERFQIDSLGNNIADRLSNEGFVRIVNDSTVSLSDREIKKYSNSVNSVHYFVQLPFGLEGDAVNKELIGKDSIKNKEYYEIKVSFDQEGGGTDYEDEYMYWINTDSFTVDYLAYSYHVNGGGIRFREAFNPRVVNGLRFVDYKNYAEKDLSTPLEKLDNLYQAGELELFSEIITEDIEVDLSE
ncbi:DUF6503 family protein [Zunongwangia sp. HRR-M8]|uniref:DUF6503 family protein n=1 Tax=Zunongwangia sp. HRR-M8 TaxID=3015170 RepID=UPI0022DE7D6B|nr:DUF6503 family protein [Zunongwangia sp. HRR-M8]WBL21404.1 deoxyribose-phosphate aldolase [Zunongwangia sp. HRR-M8]